MAKKDILLEYPQELITYVYTKHIKGYGYTKIANLVKKNANFKQFKDDFTPHLVKKLIDEVNTENANALELVSDVKQTAMVDSYAQLVTTNRKLRDLDDDIVDKIEKSIKRSDIQLRDLVLLKQMIDNSALKTIELNLKYEELKIKQAEANLLNVNDHVIIVNDIGSEDDDVDV